MRWPIVAGSAVPIPRSSCAQALMPSTRPKSARATGVVVVGAFVPFLKELKRRGQPFLVLEQDPATLKADEPPFFPPAEQAAQILPEAEVVLITGSPLVNNTLETLLALARPRPAVRLFGRRPGCCLTRFLPVAPIFSAASG